MPILKVKKNGVWEEVGGGTSYGVATETSDGLMSASDKIKLDNMPEGGGITGTVSMTQGGTGAETGAEGIANLFADGYTILSQYQFGDELPTAGMAGRIFFKKVNG